MRWPVHVDDSVCAGSIEDLRWFKERLKEWFEIKSATVGADRSAGEVGEARILNRIIRVTGEGWEYEADQRHADLIMKETEAEKMSCHPTHEGISRPWRQRLRWRRWWVQRPLGLEPYQLGSTICPG